MNFKSLSNVLDKSLFAVIIIQQTFFSFTFKLEIDFCDEGYWFKL